MTRDWYVHLLDLRVEFDSDWFVQLQDPDDAGLELGILDRDHAIAPEPSRGTPSGGYLTVVVDDVETVGISCLRNMNKTFQDGSLIFMSLAFSI